MTRITTTTPTVKEMREKGWKVRVSYYRPTSHHSDLYSLKELRDLSHNQSLDFVHPKGGKITVEIKDGEGVEHRGESNCSLNDSFNKGFGRDLAIRRALGLPIEKEAPTPADIQMAKMVISECELAIEEYQRISEECKEFLKTANANK